MSRCYTRTRRHSSTNLFQLLSVHLRKSNIKVSKEFLFETNVYQIFLGQEILQSPNIFPNKIIVIRSSIEQAHARYQHKEIQQRSSLRIFTMWIYTITIIEPEAKFACWLIFDAPSLYKFVLTCSAQSRNSVINTLLLRFTIVLGRIRIYLCNE